MAAKRKRVTPSTAELGRMPQGGATSTPRYNIIGDAGLPVGPNPLEQLTTALGSFNQSFQKWGVLQAKQQQKDAVERLPEMEKYVKDKAVTLAQYFDKEKLNPLWNPAVISTGYALMGERTAEKDVLSLLESDDFRLYAQAEMSQEGDYRGKLQNWVLGKLPNRDMDDKTKSSYWKRGYDPSVLSVLDQKLPAWQKRQGDFQLHQVREANIVKAQKTLRDSLVSGDVKPFKQEMTDMHITYPRDSAKGVRFNSEMLTKVLKPVVESAIADPDVNLDSLEDTVDRLANLRRDTEKGSTLMFGGAAEVFKNWSAKLFDAERSQPSKAWRQHKAVLQEYDERLTELVHSWDDFMQQAPELNLEGISTPKDINVDNFDIVVDHLVHANYLPFNEEKFNKLYRGTRATLINDMQNLFTTTFNRKIDDDEALKKNEVLFKRQLVQDHPQWKGIIDKINITKYLKEGTLNSGSYMDELLKDVDAAEIANDQGLEHNVVGGMLRRMISSQVDAGAGAAAQNLIPWFDQVSKNKIINPAEAQALKNVIQSIFTDDHDYKETLKAILTKIEADTDISPYVSKFKFQDIISDLAALSTTDANATAEGRSPLQRINEYARTKLSTLERRAEGDPDSDVTLVGKEAGAAQTVTLQMEDDYNRFLSEELRNWEADVTDLKQSFPERRAKIEAAVRDKMKSKVHEYVNTFNGLLRTREEEEKANRNSAINGFNADQGFADDITKLDIQYSANMKDINDMSDKEKVTYGDLRNNEKLGSGHEFATSFFADTVMSSGDARFGKMSRIREAADKLSERMMTNLSGLYTERRKLREVIDNPDVEKIKANDLEIQEKEAGLKAHWLRYRGVNWRDVHNGEAAIEFMASGEKIQLEIGLRDVNFASTILHEDWESLDRIENLFDKYEQQLLRDKALKEGKDASEYDSKTHKGLYMPISDEAIKEVEEYVDFVRKTTGLELLDTSKPSLLQENQKKHRQWAAQQRMQMIATDPEKMPEKMRFLIKRQALQNFYKSGKWQGKAYTKSDIARIKSADDYNIFLAQNPDISIKNGLNPHEFINLYSGVVAGRMYSDMHHLRGGAGRGKHGSSRQSEPVPKGKDQIVTGKQMDVMAQELAAAMCGYQNVTSLSPQHSKTSGHPYNTMRVKYMGYFNKYRKLLEPLGSERLNVVTGKSKEMERSPDLAEAFMKLYHSEAAQGMSRAQQGVSPLWRDYTHMNFSGGTVTDWMPTEWYINPIYIPNFFHWAFADDDEYLGPPVRGLLTQDPIGARKWAEESGETNLLTPFGIELKPLPNK